MIETLSPRRGRMPGHLWLVGLASLLWNTFGSYDYVMTQVRDPAYIGALPREIIDWIDTFPTWAIVAWAIGVWASLAGSVLLLLRSRHAVSAFGVSLAGAIVSFTYQYLGSDMPRAAATPGAIAMTLTVLGAIVLQWWYAKGQAGAKVLR